MKTTITKFSKTVPTPVFIIFTVFCMLMNQANAKKPMFLHTPKTVFDVTMLAPVAPREADFNDIPPVYPTFIATLAPVAPKEATFEDSGNDASATLEMIKLLAPCSPKEADFIDSEVRPVTDSENLSPALPVEASFDDTI